MKRILLTISLLCSFSVFVHAQVVFSDDFEAYVVGTQLTLQNNVDWTTWSGVPGTAEDPLVSSDYAFSGTKSILITSNPGPRDLVHPIADYTTGKYKMSFRMYIPTGFDGYFNTLQDFAGTASQWGMQAYFYAGGNGNVDAGAALAAPFTYPHDTWMLIEVIVDLNADWAEFYVQGNLIIGWIWHTGTFGTGTLNQLGGSNLFGHDDPLTVEPAQFYFDDYQLIDMLWVPVELTSFAVSVNNIGNVVINWSTATETNNHMFEIERRAETGEYFTIGFINGAGTTTEPQNYTFTDKTVETGKYFYRLKQLDFDGRYEYSDEVEVDVIGPLTFDLAQNYPNPFNPTTNIKYSVSETGNVKLSVYNTVGEEVAVLVDGFSESGFFEVSFNASGLPSGVYLYKLQSANSVQTKKMMLLK